MGDSLSGHREKAALLYRVSDSVVMRDERHLLDSDWYVVANPGEMKSFPLRADGFGVLEYLREPRSKADIDRYRVSLPATSRLAEADGMLKFVESLERMGVVEAVAEDAGSVRPVNSASGLPTSGYTPASAPLSMVVQLPMASDMFRRLIAEADVLGVLGIGFVGGESALEVLADESEALQHVRAAIAVWLRPDDLTEPSGQYISAVSAALGRPPFAIVESQGGLGSGESGKGILRSPGVPFCVSHRVCPGDGLSELKQIAAEALDAGAAFAHFVLGADSFSGVDALTARAVSEKLEVLGKVQWEHSPMQVQVRAAHIPLPEERAVPARRLRQLIGSYLGGCSAGLIAAPMPVHVRPVQGEGIHDETPPGAGPPLPVNCCQAGMTHLAIGRDCKVYPCEEALGEPDLVMGDLNASPLAEIWAGEQWTYYRGGRDVDDLSGCRGCDARN